MPRLPRPAAGRQRAGLRARCSRWHQRQRLLAAQWSGPPSPPGSLSPWAGPRPRRVRAPCPLGGGEASPTPRRTPWPAAAAGGGDTALAGPPRSSPLPVPLPVPPGRTPSLFCAAATATLAFASGFSTWSALSACLLAAPLLGAGADAVPAAASGPGGGASVGRGATTGSSCSRCRACSRSLFLGSGFPNQYGNRAGLHRRNHGTYPTAARSCACTRFSATVRGFQCLNCPPRLYSSIWALSRSRTSPPASWSRCSWRPL